MHATPNPTLGLVLATVLAACSTASAADAIDSPEKRWSADGPGGVPEFERHIQPLLGKAGCSGRSCHGSFRGQNGFRLSLFGSDPAADHKALAVENKGDGPRVNVKAPRESLALKKPTREVMHGGGQRLDLDGWQYRMLTEWIGAGAPYDVKKGTRVEEVTIQPSRIVLRKGEPAVPLRLTARFSDGSREDVTGLTIFASRDDAVAKVSEEGEVTAARPGGAAIVASYGPMVTTCQVLVPRPNDTTPFPEFPAVNGIDERVREQLQALNIRPSELASDEVFLRRVYLDLIGTLPTPAEARQFLSDPSPDKRGRLIDQLLARPEYSQYWGLIFSDLTGNSGINPFWTVSQLWQRWLEVKLAQNWPYDEIVGGILTATSLEGRPREELVAEIEAVRKNMGLDPKIPPSNNMRYDQPRQYDLEVYAKRKTLDLYWLRIPNRSPDRVALQTASAFLAVRLDCAQCHKHPFDRWTQRDFEHFQSFFRVIEYQYSPTGEAIQGKGLIQYGRDAMSVGINPRFKGFVERYPPKLLGGKEIPYKSGDPDPRVALWEWMRAPENPYFAPAIINRIWAHYFGVGLVEAVEDFSAGNPPSNPRLLEWLARDFIEHKFDLKHLHRRILNSRTYQLSWAPNDSNRLDRRNYSHALFRRMPAEVLVHALGNATGVPYQFRYTPPGQSPLTYAPNLAMPFPLELFGRGIRREACGGCDRTNEVSLNQALYFLNDVEVAQRIDAKKGRLAQLQKVADDRQVVEELYLAALSRFPTQTEMEESVRYRKECESREAWLEDLLWSLVNVREFVFVR